MIEKPEENVLVQVRPMRAEDLEAVTQIDQISFSLPWPATAFRQELMMSRPMVGSPSQNRNSILRVAEAATGEGKTEIVGLLVIWMILDEAHIATIATHPDYRRRGVAALLLADGLAESLHRGAKLATLEVRAHNEAAMALYRRFGFEEVGRRPKYYRDNFEDGVIMTIGDLERISLEIQNKDHE